MTYYSKIKATVLIWSFKISSYREYNRQNKWLTHLLFQTNYDIWINFYIPNKLGHAVYDREKKLTQLNSKNSVHTS